jgi:hypothetical protein
VDGLGQENNGRHRALHKLLGREEKHAGNKKGVAAMIGGF